MDELQALKYCIASSITEIERVAKRMNDALAKFEASSKCEYCNKEFPACDCFDSTTFKDQTK